MKPKERLIIKYKNCVVEDLYGFRVPGWALDAETIEMAIKLKKLKIVVNRGASGVKKNLGAKIGDFADFNML